ncbi:MAG: winged helix-turn-helix transcriptional regulator [Leptolyngbyaceae cyanobacterium]
MYLTSFRNAVLSFKAKQLADELIARKVYREVPPRVEYSLTGRDEPWNPSCWN